MDDELILAAASDIPVLLDFENSLKCAHACKGEYRVRIQTALKRLTEWWLTDVPLATALKTEVGAQRTEEFPKSNCSISFRIHSAKHLKRVPIVLVMIQHDYVELHDQLQVPHGDYRKLGKAFVALFDQVRKDLEDYHYGGKDGKESIRLSGIIVSPKIFEIVTAAILKLVKPLRA